MIDSHCHLADKQFDADRDAVITRAREAGVERMVTIADTLEEAASCIALAQKHPCIAATAGVHPHHASQWTEASAAMLRTLLQEPGVVAVGEIGLDYHYDRSPRDVQRAVFREQLLIAKDNDLPVVVHCRDAVEDVWSVVQELQPPRLVIHCCTDAWSDVERFVERGDLLSFTGIATYPNAAVIRDTIRHCPLEQMMIETDAPYLAPVPHRGERNEPAFVAAVAACIATTQDIAIETVQRKTTANANQFFGLDH